MRKIIGIILLGIISFAWGRSNCDRLPSNVNYNVWPIAKNKVMVFDNDTFAIKDSTTMNGNFNSVPTITYNNKTIYYSSSNYNGKEEVAINGISYEIEDQYSTRIGGEYGGYENELWVAPDSNRKALLLIQGFNGDRENGGLYLHTFDVSQDVPVRTNLQSVDVPHLITNIYAYYDGTNNWVFAGTRYSQIYVWRINSNFTLSEPTIYNDKEEINIQVLQTSLFYLAPTGDHVIFRGGATGNPLLQFWDFDKFTGKMILRMTKRSYLFYENCTLFSADGTKIYHKDNKTFLQTDLSGGKFLEGDHYYKDDIIVTKDIQGYQYKARQLAPNGKFYSVGLSGYNSMTGIIDVINAPNQKGEAMDVELDIARFDATSAIVTFPQIPTTPIRYHVPKKINIESACVGTEAKISLTNNKENATIKWTYDKTALDLISEKNSELKVKSNVSGEYPIKASTTTTSCDGVVDSLFLIDTLHIGDPFTYEIKDVSIGASCDIPVAEVNVPADADKVIWSFTSSEEKTVNISETGSYSANVNKKGCWVKDDFTVSIGEKVGTTKANSRNRNVWPDGGVSYHFNDGDLKSVAASGFQGYTYSTNATRVTICNEQGIPLFYTDGDYFWKADRTIMNNGAGILTLETSSPGFAKPFILPHPGNDQQYYVFSYGQDYDPSGSWNNYWTGSLYYDLVDLSQGPKVIEKKVKFLEICSGLFDYVLQENGKDYWLIAHAQGHDFKIFSLDKNGFHSKTPKTQTIGNYFDKQNTVATTILLEGTDLYVKSNNDAFNNTDITEKYHFDRATGVLSDRKNLIGIPFPNVLSPSGRFTYTYEAANDFKKYTVQYDMFLNTPQEIVASRTIISGSEASDKSGRDRKHKLGANGKIYVHDGTFSDMSVITNPDKKGPDVGFLMNGSGVNTGATNPFPFDKLSFSTVGSLPEFVVTNICEGQTTNIALKNGAAVSSWEIDGVEYPASPSVKVTFPKAGQKDVKLNYVGGCSDLLSTGDKITIYAMPQVVKWDTVLCGDDLQLDAQNEGYTYSWKNAQSQEIGTSQKLSITKSGTYKAHISQQGCTGISEFKIELEELPVLPLATEQFICPEEGDKIVLNPGSAFKKYEWINEGITNENLEVNEVGVYPLRLYGDSLCVAEKNIQVLEECPPVLFVPNAFSPNGDGLNDVFGVISFYVKQFEITIYNEWGEVVYHSTNVEDTWDGIYREEKAISGTYAYVVSYGSTENGELVSKEISGSITLIK